MTDPAESADRRPDWVIDLNHPPRPAMTDPRLDSTRTTIRRAQTQLQEVITTMAAWEDLVRDCAASGMTADEIATQCSVSIESVRRIIAGGTFFDFLS
jgi:DNA-directed RNA polymerase specialized sigma24 family protein